MEVVMFHAHGVTKACKLAVVRNKIEPKTYTEPLNSLL